MADDITFRIRGKNESGGAFKSFSSNLASAAKQITKIGAISAAVSNSALAIMVKKVAEADDKVGKFATRIGVATEALSSYQFVANQAGLSTETFNMATQRMTRRVAEAAKGTGEAVSALRELGINARAFQQLPLDQKMTTLSDKMSTLNNDSDKLRLAFKLFDSEGTAMIQMLEGGSEAMQAAAADAKFLGIVVDKDAAAKAKVFNDSLGRLTGSIKGVSRGIAGELMPIFSGLANSMADSLARSRDAIVTFVKNATVIFFTMVEVVRQAWATMKKVVTDPKALQGFLDNMLQLVPKVGALSIAIGKFFVMGIWEGIKVAKDLFVGFGQWIGESLAQIVLGEKVTSITEKFANVFVAAISKAKDNMVLEFEELRAVVGEILPDIGADIAETFGVNLESATENAKALIESLSLFAETTKEKVEETGIATSEFMQQLRDKQLEFTAWLEESSLQFLDTLKNTVQQTIDAMAQATAAAIVDGQNLQQSFRQITKAVIKEVIAALVKMGIQRLILSKLNIAANRADATAEASKAVALAGTNMFASYAGAPWPISLGAPAAAAAAIAGATAAFSAGAAAGAGAAQVVAHGGLTNNPEETTARIIAGERIVSPRQNRDLTEFLSGNNSGGGSVSVGNLEMVFFPNVTNAEFLTRMDKTELEDMLVGPVIGALNRGFRDGVVPEFAERTDR